MKKIEVVKASQVELKAFCLEDFIQSKEMPATIKRKNIEKVSKKMLKELADSLELSYDDADISFAKKLFNAYLKQMSER